MLRDWRRERGPFPLSIIYSAQLDWSIRVAVAWSATPQRRVLGRTDPDKRSPWTSRMHPERKRELKSRWNEENRGANHGGQRLGFPKEQHRLLGEGSLGTIKWDVHTYFVVQQVVGMYVHSTLIRGGGELGWVLSKLRADPGRLALGPREEYICSGQSVE